VMNLRENLERRNLSVTKLWERAGYEPLPEDPDDTAVDAFVDAAIDRHFEQSLPDEYRVHIEEALAAVARDDWQTETLREVFGSVCERENPETDGGDNLVACHLSSY